MRLAGRKHGCDVDAERARDGQGRRDRRPRAAVLQPVHVGPVEPGGARQLDVAEAELGEQGAEPRARRPRAAATRGRPLREREYGLDTDVERVRDARRHAERRVCMRRAQAGEHPCRQECPPGELAERHAEPREHGSQPVPYPSRRDGDPHGRTVRRQRG